MARIGRTTDSPDVGCTGKSVEPLDEYRPQAGAEMEATPQRL